MTGDERAALLERYRDGAGVFIATVAQLSDAELDVRSIEGEWTVREICHHLADSEMTSAIRLRRLIAEDNPAIVGYDEMRFSQVLHYDDRPIPPSLEAAAAARASTLQILERLTEAEWGRQGTHSERGAYGVEAWLEDYANHPWDHADQARRVLEAARAD
jgi:hypothetical protein